jgi:hypothetical protein
VRTKPRKLRAAGIPEHDARRWAFSRKGYWRIAGSPILNPTAASGMLSEPPGADPHAGWCGGRRGELGAYPILRGARHSNVPGLPVHSGRAVGPARTRLRRVADFSALTPTAEVRPWQLRDRDVRRRCRRPG